VLEHAWSRYSGRGVVFLGVDYHDLAPDARRFVAAHDLGFTMLQDGSGTVTGRYGISQVPETYIVGRSGMIVAHIPGPITASGFGAEFQHGLAEALGT
jgi:peroxiredoxin